MLEIVGSEWRKLLLRSRYGRRFSAAKSSVVLKPSRIRIENGGSIKLEPGAVIERGARIVARARLEVGEQSYVGESATLIAFAPLKIGKRVLIGERTSVHTEDHGPHWNRDLFCVGAVTIEDDVWIGAGVVVLKAVSIGARSTIGANSVVNRDVQSDVLSAGIPARSIRVQQRTATYGEGAES